MEEQKQPAEEQSQPENPEEGLKADTSATKQSSSQPDEDLKADSSKTRPKSLQYLKNYSSKIIAPSRVNLKTKEETPISASVDKLKGAKKISSRGLSETPSKTKKSAEVVMQTRPSAISMKSSTKQLPVRPSVTIAPKLFTSGYRLSRGSVRYLNESKKSSLRSSTPPDGVIQYMTSGRKSIVGTPDAEFAQMEMERTGVVKKRHSAVSTMSMAIKMPSESRYRDPSLVALKRQQIQRRSRIGSIGSSTSLLRIPGAEVEKTKQAKFMNTYRLESKNPFKPENVQKIIIDHIGKELEGVQYEPSRCSKLCMSLSADLRSKVKALGYDRYKIVSLVSIGEKNSQSSHNVMTFIWDGDRDNYSFYIYENSFLYAIVCVFGVYYD